MKTLGRLRLSFAEVTVRGGEVDLTIVGEGGKRVVLELDPSGLGYLGAELHRGVKALQERLDSAKRDLRGED